MIQLFLLDIESSYLSSLLELFTNALIRFYPDNFLAQYTAQETLS